VADETLTVASYEACVAVFSADRAYRYRWDCDLPLALDGAEPPLVVVMLNPSKADERRLDPTVTRLMGRAVRMRAVSLTVLNLFAFRATEPAVMLTAADPVGPQNDRVICEAARALPAARWVAAWGTTSRPVVAERARQVEGLLADAFGLTLRRIGAPTLLGSPRHPLYCRAEWPLEVHREPHVDMYE
jgi:hypothetical protein